MLAVDQRHRNLISSGTNVSSSVALALLLFAHLSIHENYALKNHPGTKKFRSTVDTILGSIRQHCLTWTMYSKSPWRCLSVFRTHLVLRAVLTQKWYYQHRSCWHTFGSKQNLATGKKICCQKLAPVFHWQFLTVCHGV